MEDKLSTYGYSTQEASYVFTFLASSAAERLGLKDELAQAFGRGYSWIRTGWFEPKGIQKKHVIKQIIFFKLLFPSFGRDFWDFNSPLAKIKLKAVFDKFVTWQNVPENYVKDLRNYEAQLGPLWLALSSTLDFPRGSPK